jgi:S-adenosyl-L-methionine hydrolase (adenosine-forming)
MIITLTTDFGYKDPFVGIMKGVIASINPRAHVIDLSHGVAPQDIMGGALVLRHAVSYFPQGSIHVVVVDPGVGSARRPLLIETSQGYFIGPDNGVLSLALTDDRIMRIIDLSHGAFHRQPISATFHGRDMFAPAAAHLSLTGDAAQLGVTIGDFARITWPQVEPWSAGWQGQIVYIDNFGNLFTNVTQQHVAQLQDTRPTIALGDIVIHGLADNYTAGAPGDYIALINSWGLLEIAVCQENAQRLSGARIGDKIYIHAQ